ncbi:beta-1,3-galactosyl-O-glycosyl-glycoprotein beta-1,6-N-acetylglucosaminyltransferase 3 [Ictalurus punctatus]|uniref:Beta-1,3-galactosyl-O-glycosyl-glycoprotein beta-1,6-N-acetylglucosaminyltransferase 3 n=1 Tax=Ictalurus punctatus TaxID=7998 RepID=A0A2D0SC06_ICTPU|nr:beta-1,3-galactosyl-O-glycosyl-glycoprotein beta-1,6-N-acetylglucosaminyltransferase 3 [Ictalurus punctatus]XP_047009910.2 beta-1,3-galactosyl-O-glycosyl-glycoprotein beta-1,6-N-acetylglucosaminyltransferase 3 [Ictalurus punctatus]
MAFKGKKFWRYISLCFFSFSLIYFVMYSTKKGCLESGLPDMEHLIKHSAGELQACSAIIRGDMDGVNSKHFGNLLAGWKKASLLSESFYLNVTKDCQAFVRDSGFLTAPLSKEERDFPIAYSMVIHEKIEMFERLLRAIYTPQNVYCVHVDQKSPKIFSEAVQAIVSCFPNVFVASKLESVVYASWSRVQADINCMEDLLKSPVKWRYLLNTCGADFPLKTNAELVRSLKNLNGKNSMESEVTPSHKKARWEYHHNITNTVTRTGIKKTPPPIGTPMFSGNAYFVVTREFVEYIFKTPEIQNFMEWEKDTYSPDEHMWATLHRMPSVPGSNPPNEKFDESDMLAIARLVKWSYHEGNIKNGAPYPPCTGTYRHAVCVYGAGDLNWILKQKHLFANKFDPQVDDIAIKCMEAFLRYQSIYGQSLFSIGKTKIIQ